MAEATGATEAAEASFLKVILETAAEALESAEYIKGSGGHAGVGGSKSCEFER